MSLERRNLRAYGAELVLTPGSEGMNGAVKKAEEILKENAGFFMAEQFKNQANVKIHRETTGPEIVEAIESIGGSLDAFVAGIGTGGTITGAGEVLKEQFPDIKVIAVEPVHRQSCRRQTGPHKIQGIGANFIPEILNQEVYDEIIHVENDDAFETSAAWRRKKAFLEVFPPVRLYMRH